MAAYVTDRRRTLTGMGSTLYFRPRLRGMGDSSTDIDVVTGLPCDDPRANCGPSSPALIPAPDLGPGFTAPPPIAVSPGGPALPPDFFTPARPILPPSSTVSPSSIPAPSFPGPAAPSPIQVVFPSQGTVTPATKPAAAATSWLDQQMIAGVPNKFLAVGVAGLFLFFGMANKGRRR